MPPWSWWVPHVCPLLVLVTSVKAGTIAFETGYVRGAKVTSSVSGITFSVTEGGTVALCDLEFESDLSIIASASVSCRTLYDSDGGQGSIGETNYSWTFYAEIGGSVYNVGATILFSPASNTLTTLVLCIQPVCTDTDQHCLVFPHYSSSSSSTAMSSSKIFNYPSQQSSASTNSSTPEGFVFVLSSNPSISSAMTEPSSSFTRPITEGSSASTSSSTPEGFVFNFGSTPESSSGPSELTQPEATSSSASFSSSTPEGFVFNFGSAGRSSSSSGAGTTATTVNTTVTNGGTTAVTEVQAGTTASTSTLV